ncbi:translation initiation factor IF-2 [Streptomyces sp. NPDC047017]|uniref:translation initiation factor IF-2 n=1 Tax=Streptomyces sp. NPDC047017 TaxID=3155024 RepID=UPI0033E2F501
MKKGLEQARPVWPAAAEGSQDGAGAQTFPATGALHALRVDVPDRRSRRFRRLGWAVGFACAGYAVAIVVALVSGNSHAPWLPVPGRAGDRPAGKADTTPGPSGPARAPGNGAGVAAPGVPGLPGASATATGIVPGPAASATAAGTATGPHAPGSTTVPRPTASGTAGPKPPVPGASGPVAVPTPPPASAPGDPAPSTGDSSPSTAPSEPAGGGSGGTSAPEGSRTVARAGTGTSARTPMKAMA